MGRAPAQTEPMQECGGASVCPHQRRRYHCKECGLVFGVSDYNTKKLRLRLRLRFGVSSCGALMLLNAALGHALVHVDKVDGAVCKECRLRRIRHPSSRSCS